MSNNVNPILLRPALGIVLAIGSVLLKLEQLMSWLQSGHHAVILLQLAGASVSAKQLTGGGSGYYLQPLRRS